MPRASLKSKAVAVAKRVSPLRQKMSTFANAVVAGEQANAKQRAGSKKTSELTPVKTSKSKTEDKKLKVCCCCKSQFLMS